MKLGTFPEMSLSKARQKLERLKAIRKSGRCPATEKRDIEQTEKETKAELQKQQDFTVRALIDKYLEKYIDDRMDDGNFIPGARKPKGQNEVRRTLYADPIKVLGKKSASKITRKDVIAMVMGIVDRGANVQAGNVLRELLAAYEFAIGLEIYFEDDFVNPCLQAKAGLRRAKIKLTAQRGKRVLNDIELGQLLRWLPGSAYTVTQKNALRMALWTGCRTGEVVRRKPENECSARYITIAPVRELSLVISRMISEATICADIAEVPICTNRSRNVMNLFLERLFNNNALDYFYLHAEPSKGLAKSYCAFLRLPIALHANEHYDKILNSRILGLNENFQSKLSWLVGQLFSRVGTQDWEKEQLSKNTKQALRRNIVWIDDKQEKQYSKILSSWSDDNPGEKADLETIGVLAKQVRKKKEIVISRIEELMLNYLSETDVRAVIKSIENDPEISASFK
jgi:hypothetical protein